MVLSWLYRPIGTPLDYVKAQNTTKYSLIDPSYSPISAVKEAFKGNLAVS